MGTSQTYKVQTNNHCIKRVAGYPRPMLMPALQHIRQVWLQSPSINMFAIATIIAILQTQEVIVNIAQIVRHIAETDILGVFAELKLVGSAILFFLSFSHGLSRITPLTPEQWVADTLPGSPPVTGEGR